VIPDVNISIDNPVAVVDKTLTSTAEKLPRRLSIFFSQAQREFAKVGFRPVDPTVAEEVAKQYTKIKLSSLLKIWVAGFYPDKVL